MNAILKDREERARKAVSAFRAMQPGLTGYVRALTGNKSMTVKITDQGGYTDGKDIYVKPPIALGDLTSHQRSLCDKRDADTLLQRCDACRIREEVLSLIYHEIAHNAFGTFTQPTDSAKAHAIESAIREVGTKYARRIRETYERLPKQSQNSYMPLVGLISPFLPVLVNAIEDARVDARMFEARRGTRVMFDARTRDVFRRGYEEADGTRSEWRDRPLNSQAIIGVYTLACGYTPDGWFAPSVEEALGDQTLIELALTAPKSTSAHDTYYLSFKILARLRELGFCLNSNEPQDEDEDEEQDDGGMHDEGDQSFTEGWPSSPEESSSTDEASDGEPGDDESEGSPSGEAARAGGGSNEGSPEESGDGTDQSADGDGYPGSTEPLSSGDESSADGNDGPRPESGSGESDESEDRDAEAGGVCADAEDDDGDSDYDSEDGDELTDGEGSDSSREDREGSDHLEDFADEADGGADSARNASESDSGPSEPDFVELEPVDTGADDGEGGIEAESAWHGDADQAIEDLYEFTGHVDGSPVDKVSNEALDDEAITVAVIQGQYFETSSVNVLGVRESKYGQVREDGTYPEAWRPLEAPWRKSYAAKAGIDVDTEVSESILGPALLEMRRVFADNERASMERHLRSGRVNQRVLGKRAWVGDDRLFQKKRLPGKKSYSVLLGIDISYSTVGVNISLAKRAAMAQAELLHRAGIEFAIYAHSANDSSNSYNHMWLDVYEVKSFDAPWGTVEQKALSELSPVAENLDGHTVEFYRKTIEKRPATDKIILYYSDGKMPAANHDEELEVLQREIDYCKRKQITLLGVGIRTDSPRRHGLDTVQVNDASDTVQVIRHLKNALVRSR